MFFISRLTFHYLALHKLRGVAKFKIKHRKYFRKITFQINSKSIRNTYNHTEHFCCSTVLNKTYDSDKSGRLVR